MKHIIYMANKCMQKISPLTIDRIKLVIDMKNQGEDSGLEIALIGDTQG